MLARLGGDAFRGCKVEMFWKRVTFALLRLCELRGIAQVWRSQRYMNMVRGETTHIGMIV
jgi:hypothetical protein